MVSVYCHSLHIFFLIGVWPTDVILFYGKATPHNHFFLAKWTIDIVMGLGLKPIALVPFVDDPAPW